MQNYPLTDEFMVYDYTTHRYVLTDKDVFENLGINLSARIKNPTAVQSLLNQISAQVYDFIHEHNVNNRFQDFVIAVTESGRQIIKRAMEEQLKYVLMVGDLSRSTDREKRSMWFDMNAERELSQPICEVGFSVLYAGTYPFVCTQGVKW